MKEIIIKIEVIPIFLARLPAQNLHGFPSKRKSAPKRCQHNVNFSQVIFLTPLSEAYCSCKKYIDIISINCTLVKFYFQFQPLILYHQIL